jgi:hypothetical protein
VPLDLETLQTGLLELIKRRRMATDVDDPYLQLVDGSDQLALVQEITEWWRALVLEESAPLTAALLKQRGLFDEAVLAAARSSDVNPFRGRQADAFLLGLRGHRDPLVAAVASFERALLAVRLHGSTDRFEVIWPRSPYEVLESLLSGTQLDERLDGPYRMEVADDIPGGFRVEPGPAR